MYGKLVTLDEDTQVYAASAAEARYIFDEVFGADCYGVGDLPERPFVVDVGANIGLFTLFVKRLRPAARILAFEPMPESAALLKQNLMLHRLDAVQVHELALGRATEAAARFTFYPQIPGNSTRHPEIKEAPRARLARTMPAKVVEHLYQGREVTVAVDRLSRFLPAGQPIDLLKVDVEGAEVDVLDGVDQAQWPLVRRVTAETYELGGRIGAVREILHRHGFASTVQPVTPDGPYLVDARRPPGEAV